MCMLSRSCSITHFLISFDNLTQLHIQWLGLPQKLQIPFMLDAFWSFSLNLWNFDLVNKPHALPSLQEIMDLSRFLVKKGPILYIYQLDQLAILEKLIWTHSHWLLVKLLMCPNWPMVFYQWLYICQLNHLVNSIINSCGHMSTSYTILVCVFLPCVNIWLVHYL